MSAEPSVPPPQESGVDISDSALLRGITAEAPFAFAVFDVEGRFQRVNEAFTDLTGLPVDRHIGRLPEEFLPADLAAVMSGAVRRVVEEDRPVTDGDVRTRLSGGETRHWSLVFFPARDEGRLIGVGMFG